jgi:energy-coupling factor transporter ATP-binding protein EcfA2
MTAASGSAAAARRAKPAHLEVRGLGAGYGPFLVLRELTLEARPGVTVILGPNGAGKSTLLKAIAGLIPRRGQVLLDGDEIPARARASEIVERGLAMVAEGRSAETIAALTGELASRGCTPEQVNSVTIDMSPAFIKGTAEHLPRARITFDKFHVIWHASTAVDKMRRIEQRTEKSLKGMRWSLLKDRSRLSPVATADLDALIARMTTLRTARAWAYKERLREILERKQINVVRAMLQHWCNCVMRSKVEPMKEVARLVRTHLEGIVAWAQTRQTNGFLEALNGLFQAAKRRARGFKRMSTIRTVIFMIAGKLDFSIVNPHADLAPISCSS